MNNNKNFPSLNKYRKYFLLVPVILMFIAVIVGVIFKFNLSTDFKQTYTFTVSYNTTVNQENYDKYVEKIASVLDEKGEANFDYAFDKLNEDIALATKVTISNSKLTSTELNNKFNSISIIIENEINELIGNGHIDISNLSEVSPLSFSNQLINLAVALLISVVIIFALTWIRYELKLAISSLFILPYNIGILLALMTIFRLPFNFMFTVPFYLTTLVSYLIFVIIADKVRDNVNKDEFTEDKNEELIFTSINQSKKLVMIILLALTICVLLSMLSLSLPVFFVAIASLLGLLVAVYTSTFVVFSIWSKIYSKDNDKKLKAKKLKKEQPKTKKSKEEDDKIVV